MLQMRELIGDPDFSTTFEIVSTVGAFEEGVYRSREERTSVVGIARPASADDLDLLPEGDRVKGVMAFYALEPMIFTPGTLAPFIVYKNRRYKIVHSEDYSDNGFYKATGTLLGKDESNVSQ